MKQELVQAVEQAVKDLFGVDVAVELTRPDAQFGDFATNVALQLAGKMANPVYSGPREIGEALAEKLRASEHVAGVAVAGPGFLNISLTDSALVHLAATESPRTLAGKTILTEYSDPNPFKVLHVGHLYTSVNGDAISNLLEHAGATVHRVNFGGDVGLHVGKTMWAIMQDLGGENPEKLAEIPEVQRSEWMAKNYVKGTQAYEEDETAKAEIIAINKRVYGLHTTSDHTSSFAQIYWTCRQWSYEYFDAFYARIGSKFEKYYPESETAAIGLRTVQQQLEAGVFQRSDGAVVFEGEPYGLHTRVFINSEGLPTYEAKDVGLSIKKWDDYRFDESVIITGNDIVEYMKVVLKAIEQFQPDLAKRTTHLTHGNVKLAGGVKMSSRKGNFLRAVDVLDMVAGAGRALNEQVTDETVLGAVKYAFVKQRMGADIIFNPQESVAIEGNSGPYLQYAHARARSIIAKSSSVKGLAFNRGDELQVLEFETDERMLLRKIGEYSEVIARATQELMPHHICTYLYELAQEFNRFYEKNRVIDDTRENVRLQLVAQYADTLKSGLGLLGIYAPEKL
jgi:arginyl-tRNA synthetase